MFNLYDHFKSGRNSDDLRHDQPMAAAVSYEKGEDLVCWSPHSFLVYVAEGRILIENFQSQIEPGKGEAGFCKKGAYRLYIPDQPVEILFVFIPDTFIRERFMTAERAAGKSIFQFTRAQMLIEQDALLNLFFESLRLLFVEEQKENASLLSTKMTEFLLLTGKSSRNEALKHYLHTTSARTGANISDIMSRNYLFNLAEAEFSRICGLEPDRFRREFEQIYSKSPRQWLIEKRLEYGRIQLLITDELIESIACKSGFESPAHFIRSFKRQFGLPPAQFRKTHVFG